MLAARYHAKHRLVVEEVPIPEPGQGQVQVRVRYCGICGTDVHIFEGDKGSMDVVPPRILGHEFSGVVSRVGPGVSHLAVGDRVAADVNYSCGHCEACARGQRHFCDNMRGAGTALDGAFAEYIALPAGAAFRVPDSVDDKAASMVEPISCCLHGMDLTGVGLGDRVLVIGAGSIGLVMLQLARRAGASKVAVSEPSEARRRLALELGADLCLDPSSGDFNQALRSAGIARLDKVIDCAGKTTTAEFAVRVAGKGATVMLFGLTAPDEEMRLKPFTLFEKELTLKASFVNPNAFGRALDLLAAGMIRTDRIITDVYPLRDIQRVFAERLYMRNGKTIIEA